MRELNLTVSAQASDRSAVLRIAAAQLGALVTGADMLRSVVDQPPEGVSIRVVGVDQQNAAPVLMAVAVQSVFLALSGVALPVVGHFVLKVAEDVVAKVAAERVSKHLEKIEATRNVELSVNGAPLPKDLEARRLLLLALFEQANSPNDLSSS